MSSHYFSKEPIIKKLKTRYLEVEIRGFYLKFVTLPGVFSPKYIDEGTQLLAENMIIKDNWIILDLGCGYGVLGIVAAKLAPNGMVYMVDINETAIKLAKINARLNNVKNVKIKHGNLFEPVKNIQFDTIITNPPISAGLELNYKIIHESINYLKQGGLFQIVLPSKMADRLAQEIEKTYGNIELLAKTGTHRVFVAERI